MRTLITPALALSLALLSGCADDKPADEDPVDTDTETEETTDETDYTADETSMIGVGSAMMLAPSR